MKRKAAWAGQFYPASPDELTRTVDAHINAARVEKPRGQLLALVIPHAGYVYSGAVAGHAYRYLRESGAAYDSVVLIGSAHHAFVDGASVYGEGGFASPLGEVAVDSELARVLVEGGGSDDAAPHLPEHSLEVQLPFLQSVLKGFKIVPVLLGPRLAERKEQGISEVLAAAIKGKRTLLLASTDMSHYPSYGAAREVDERTLRAIASLDADAIDRALDEAMAAGYTNLDTALCGESAVRLVLRTALALGADKGLILNYANSGDVSGDKSQVVGYGAVAFVKS